MLCTAFTSMLCDIEFGELSGARVSVEFISLSNSGTPGHVKISYLLKYTFYLGSITVKTISYLVSLANKNQEWV